MTPVIIPGFTHVLKGPPGCDVPPLPPGTAATTETTGSIADLHIILAPPYIISEWEPSPEERAAIAAGRDIVLSVMSRGMPPVALALAPARCLHCRLPMADDGHAHAHCADIVRAGSDGPDESETKRADDEKIASICAVMVGDTGAEFTMAAIVQAVAELFERNKARYQP